MVTIDEIARRSGVSKSTVSNVLNNRDDRVSPETKSKVLQIVDELGYRSRKSKRGFSLTKTSTMVVLFPHSYIRLLNQPLYQELMNGVAEGANSLNYQVITTTSGQDFNPSLIYEDFINAGLGEGYLITELLKRDGRLKRFSRGMETYVCLGKPEVQDNRGVSWVFIDMMAMVEKAVRQLIAAGHQNIVFLGTEERRIVDLQAYRGYMRALEGNQIPIQQDLRFNLEPDPYQAEKTMREILERNPAITAVFCESQVQAEGVLKAARETGRHIPKDLAVMSMLENRKSEDFDPPLSGVDWKARELGDQAVRLLVRMIEGNREDISGRVVATEVIVRESCGTRG